MAALIVCALLRCASFVWLGVLSIALSGAAADGTLPHYERETPGFATQVLWHTWRATLQIVRNWPGVVMDIALVFAAGVFLGLGAHPCAR